MEKITVVVPCFNEEAVLPTFYEKITEIKNRLSEQAYLSLLFVDDGSRDGTARILSELAENDTSVGYISLSRNFGKEAALLAGLEAASGDYVAVMDVDMQDPPEYVIYMYDMLKRKPDLDCVAARRITRRGEPPSRSFFAHSFYKLINKISDTKITDGARDFRMMRREMVDAVLSLGEKCRFSKGLFSWVGFHTGWLEFENTERVAGDTKWSFWGLLKYAFEGILAFTTAPLVLPLIFAGMFLTSSVVLTVLAAVLQVSGLVTAVLALSAVITFCTSAILTAMGIMSSYTSKMYREAKNRPVYIVRRRGGNL